MATPAIAALRERRPDIRVELLVDNRAADLLAGEADIALRAGLAPTQEGLVARRLADTPFGIYCSAALAHKGYDADALRRTLRQAGAVPVIPGRITRKKKLAYDRDRYRDRHLVENAFCRLKDFRRVATRYDKLAANFLCAVGPRRAPRLLALKESGP